LIGLVFGHGMAPQGPLAALIAQIKGGHPETETLVVAADGGALVAESLGLRPDVVVGDFDSLPPSDADRLRSSGVELIGHPAEKDESDTELAVRTALERGATTIWILGGLGGPRFEHSLANVLLLALPELSGADAALSDGLTTVRLLDGAHRRSLELRGDAGDWISLLPLSEQVSGVATDGLAYPLGQETLAQGPTRGLSNELSGTVATVAIATGRLAVIHTHREAER
jgi:thiamine pyrophosphokinase